MLKKQEQQSGRLRRKRRIRKKVTGTTERPRLTVFRSKKGVYIQVIDDSVGKTLVSAASNEPQTRDAVAEMNKTDQAREVGKILAKRALDKGIDQVVFDRNGYIYHGRVAAVAEGAREGGLRF